MVRRSRKQVKYTISTVAEMFEIHPQTLRMYEREGLIEPMRSEGRTRLYEEKDLEKLEMLNISIILPIPFIECFPRDSDLIFL